MPSMVLGPFALGDDDDDSKTPEWQAVTKLRAAYEKLEQKHPPFARGDLIRHRYGEQSGLKTGDYPVIFMGYLRDHIAGAENIHEPDDLTGPAAAMNFDCRVLCYIGGNHPRIVHYLTDSSQYEPCPEITADAPKTKQ